MARPDKARSPLRAKMRFKPPTRLPLIKRSGRGGRLEWRVGVTGTNLAATPEQQKTWFLWEFGNKHGAAPAGTIVGKVVPSGKQWLAFDFNSKALGSVRTLRRARLSVEKVVSPLGNASRE